MRSIFKSWFLGKFDFKNICILQLHYYFSFIGSKCYYFEKDAPGSFNKTQNYCNGIFGENMAGKIFEPRDSYTNEVVLKEAEEVMGCTCYSFIGVKFEVVRLEAM